MAARRESPKKTEAAEKGVGASSRVEELPKAIVRRMVKEKLSDLSGDVDISLHKDALLAFSESARIFIHYLSATANDICKESRRQIVNADDVLAAIKDIEFPEFIEPLQASLDELRKKNAGKAKKGEASKPNKRNSEGENSEAKEGSKKKKKDSKTDTAADADKSEEEDA
ncbi:hypothetical protein MLD38_004083 [Melastoma candidum]|uniref:Uncharacterized protein n=1 Tax=Melastoma candidum TaxID=119954 RepID=A0ACB9S648_9MYRT|nr:hypothetical protein MLD38_004083 [Melastoma candidum]